MIGEDRRPYVCPYVLELPKKRARVADRRDRQDIAATKRFEWNAPGVAQTSQIRWLELHDGRRHTRRVRRHRGRGDLGLDERSGFACHNRQRRTP
jgi:hypothetical protein